MTKPSAYGSGGQGYGVHLIGASRSLILNLEVEQARHGVVVDFGSSDSQIIGGHFTQMNQALLDIHGEASRDTLIRGASMSNSNIGVIIGGGGRTVHCNDGPRHHVPIKRDQRLWNGGFCLDYTAQSYIRSNTLSNNSSHIVAAFFGAHEVTVERNDMRVLPLNPSL